MAKRTLIVNASPRPHGDTAALLAELKAHLEGEVVEISAFRSKVSPCVDCRRCAATARCVIRDEMDVIYGDDFDAVILGTPIYYATVPGPMLSLMSRFQPQRAAKYNLGKPLDIKPKKAGLIMVGGSKLNDEKAERPCSIFFRMVNGQGWKDHKVKSLYTDITPAAQDEAALEGVRELARWINEGTLE